MAQENLKKTHTREIEEKDQELEDMRANTHKKLKTMENQVYCLDLLPCLQIRWFAGWVVYVSS